MGLSATELDEALRKGLESTRWRPSAPFRLRRYAIWMTLPTVRIDGPEGELRWDAYLHDYRGWGFTRRQAKQMRRALARGFKADADRLNSLILGILDRDPAQ